MVGYPGEEDADVQQTVELVRELAPDEYSCTVAYPLKGTPFYDAVKDKLLPVDWTSSNNNRLVWASPYPERYYTWQLIRVALTSLLSPPQLGRARGIFAPLHFLLDALSRAVDPRVPNPAYPISKEAQRATMGRTPAPRMGRPETERLLVVQGSGK
jgi:radical SAM superfamily enzyme YgiQ (UPF0313 family)